jgi:7,8-dihydropterin-6-yl-methyl-4-(beta-D-ribofuranosyl)aminobenzene 5'-phosphate synthase
VQKIKEGFMGNKKGFHHIKGISITVITDNYYDSLRPDPPCGRRFRTSPDKPIHAEHGLSFYIDVVSKGRVHNFMFDYGIDPAGIINNMKVIGLNPAKIEAMVLSHGHFDHWGGLMDLLSCIETNNPGQEIPFFVGKNCFSHRFSVRPGSKDLIDLGELKKETIEQSGMFRVIEAEEPEEILKGVYITGRIERTTEYEKVPDNLLVERGGRIEQDYFDEELAVFSVLENKGLVIISGCAHAGIVNTVRYIKQLTGIKKVHAIIGGFHLINAPTDFIKRTIYDIKEVEPDYIIPMHCTGFEAIVSFAHTMPDKFILNTAGTTYTFS